MRRLALFMMSVLLTVIGVSAQDQATIRIALSSDPGTFNPLVQPNPNLTSLLWSRLLDVDPTTGTLVPGLAESWEISNDGLTYTVHLRDDLFWSDGTPITAADYEFAFQAIISPALNSPLSRALPPEVFETFVIVDDQTFSFSIARPNCSVLTRVNSVFALPSHKFAHDFSDLASSSIFTQNGVSSGPYTVLASTPGDTITLTANPNYFKGAPLIPNLFLHIIPEGEIVVQALEEERIDAWHPSGIWYFVPVMNRSGEYVSIESVTSPVTVEERDRLVEENAIPLPDNTNLFQTPSTAVTYLVINIADPANPQPRYDASGSRIDQGVHPIFGDPSVRRAIGLAAHNYEASREDALFPTGGNLVTPQSWAYDPTLNPYPFSVEDAAALLDEAGWVDHDNDPATPRVCEDCQYATDGEPLAFDVTYDTVRPEIGWIAQGVQQQLGAVGAQVTLLPNAVAPGAPSPILNQDFDMALISLGSFPTDPSFVFETLLLSSADLPGRGFNIASYWNDQVDQLLLEARTLPGCEPETRAELYREAQAIISNEAVYIPLGILPTNYVASDRVNGFDPRPGQANWNIETWTINQPPGS